MATDILQLIGIALSKLDWSYVTLSRVHYFDGKRAPEAKGEFRWQERPFAYELYHQLRLIWDGASFDSDCVIHSEVAKEYQKIKELGDKIPDFLFHLPQPDCNWAVVEVKLAKNPKLQDDFDKLTVFASDPLNYRLLIEVIIGSDAELRTCELRLGQWEQFSKQGKNPANIDVFFVSVDTHGISHKRTAYTHSDSWRDLSFRKR